MKKLVISLVLVNLLAACASNKPAETTAAPAGSAAGTAASTQAASASSVDALNDPASILAKRSAYYPFDVSVVQEADKPMIQAHGQYLANHADRKVRLEGNCDERGSNEYNLALGQRRADGVKKMLEVSGAKTAQLDSVSYGEEKPKASGHDEASWAQNRRTDLNYAK
ncbi:MAG TPA: peptidoglycan-associated lipoprotein Pal [Gallionella sp.]|nr:peptidoglycan-associated lipoprotein Pal [Gallionella sp.]